MTYCYFCKGSLKDSPTQSYERYYGVSKTKKYYCHECKVLNKLGDHPATIFEIFGDEDRLYKADIEIKIREQKFLIELNLNEPQETWVYPIVDTMLGTVTKGTILKLTGIPLTPNNIMVKLPLYLTFL